MSVKGGLGPVRQFTAPALHDVQASITSDVGLFHKAMSRRRSLAEDCFAERDELASTSSVESDASAVAAKGRAAKSRGSSARSESPFSCALMGETIEEECFVVIDEDGVSKPEMRVSPLARNLGSTADEDNVFIECSKQTITMPTETDAENEEKSLSKSPPPPPKVSPEKPLLAAESQAENEEAEKHKERAAPYSVQSEGEYDSTDFDIGNETSFGGNSSMTLSNNSEVEGIETSFGPDKPMSPDRSDVDGCASSIQEATSSAVAGGDQKKRKRSVREVFRLGLFVSKNKNKKRAANPTPTSGPPQAEPEESRQQHQSQQQRPTFQRRISRLEMNEPIEDIFNEVHFETIDKSASPKSPADELEQDDNDVIEDPDLVVMSSLLEKQCSTDRNAEEAEHRRDEDFLTLQGGSFDAGKPLGNLVT